MRFPAVPIAATILALALPAHSQDRPIPTGAPAYKVEFDIRDGLAGAPHPSLHYTMWVDESRKVAFLAGSRVPYASNQHVDVGVNIEFALHASGGNVTLDGTLSVSGITGEVCVGLCMPIIGQRKMSFEKTVELSKPTMLAHDLDTLAKIPTPKAANAAPDLTAMREVEVLVTRSN